jgi:macrolide-specific efflux system membrane fusion protein
MQILRILKPWQITVLVVLIAGIAGGSYGIYKSVAGPAATTTSSNIRYAQVSYGNIFNSVSGSGNLVFSNETDLSFSTSGTVTSLTVKEGDTVTKGQTLACIDTASLILAYGEAYSNLLSAQMSLINTSDSNEITSRAIKVSSAEYQLEKAQKNLNEATLRAPFDGVVTTVNIKAGESSGSGTAIVIVDPSAMEVDAVVSEADVPQVEIGQQATVSIDALSDIEFSGTVTSLALTGQSSSGVVSYPVVIQITLPSGVQPRGGMSATATIITEQATNVLIVPNRAITGASTDNPTVTVVTNNVSATRAVTIGLVGDSYTEITSGLSYGETVSYTISTTSSSSSSSSSGGFPGGGMMPSGGMFP